MKHLEQLLEEASSVSAGDAVEPEEKVEEHDRVITTLLPEELSLWTLSYNYARKADEAKIEARYNRDPTQRKNWDTMYKEYMDKSGTVNKLFWAEIQLRTESWGKPLALRTNWQIVEVNGLKTSSD